MATLNLGDDPDAGSLFSHLTEPPAPQRPSYEELKRYPGSRAGNPPWDPIPQTIILEGKTVLVDWMPSQPTRLLLCHLQNVGVPIEAATNPKAYHPVQQRSFKTFGEFPYRGHTEDDARAEIRRVIKAFPADLMAVAENDPGCQKWADACEWLQ